MSDFRLFEYAGHWLIRQPYSPHLYIQWCRPGTRRVLRKSTRTHDLDEARRRLIAFAEGRGMSRAGMFAHVPDEAAATAVEPRSSPHSYLQGHDTVKQPGLHALLDLLAAYLERLGPTRPSYVTALGSLRHWTRFCERFDVVYVGEFTHDVQERYVDWRRRELKQRGQTGSNATINRELALLKSALRLAWRRGQLQSVPYVITLPNPPARDRFVTAEEAQRLLAVCDQPYVYRFVLLALHTLARPKAIFNLRVEQVDLVNNRINLLPAGAIQSNKRRPILPITPTLRAELVRAVAESKSGYIVEKDGLPLKSMRKAFARVARKAGLTGVTPYILRHTGATLLSAAGVPMQQIASMLGHTTQRTTEIYAKRRPEFLSEAAGTLDTLFGVPSASKERPNQTFT